MLIFKQTIQVLLNKTLSSDIKMSLLMHRFYDQKQDFFFNT